MKRLSRNDKPLNANFISPGNNRIFGLIVMNLPELVRIPTVHHKKRNRRFSKLVKYIESHRDILMKH